MYLLYNVYCNLKMLIITHLKTADLSYKNHTQDDKTDNVGTYHLQFSY